MCPRTVCTLAHVFEAAGLATIVLTPMRPAAERMGVPRALYTDFPLGRSLGKPSDQQFQLEVLRAAFALLEEPEGPVIRDFPISVSLDDSQPLQWPLPPRLLENLLMCGS